MGVSIAISGGILMMSLMIIFVMGFAVTGEFFNESVVSSNAFDNNDEIAKTQVSIGAINASSGNPSLVNFTVTNTGSEKLWNYDDFDVIITYDADIAGKKTVVTEQFDFNSEALSASTAQALIKQDFKIQRGSLLVPAASVTGTLTEGVDFEKCSYDCFIKVVNTRNTGTGWVGTGGNTGTQGTDEWMFYVTDDTGLTSAGDTVTFTRHLSATREQRVQWEIWEYIGNSGKNEMKVWDAGSCTFGTTSTTCNGAAIDTFDGDDNKVVVFLTGQANPDGGTGDYAACNTTTEWLSATKTPQITRIGTGGDACDVSYAVVEFSGSNWSVERIPHSFTGVNPQTESITDVGDISRAFFHHQQRNDDLASTDGLCQQGSEVELTGPSTITYRLPQSTTGWGSNMQGVIWVISNSGLVPGEPMIVEHQNPPERTAAGVSEGANNEEDEWSVTITALTYREDETVITGMTSQSAGCGTAFPRGSISGHLLDPTTVKLYQSDDNNDQEYTFQVTQLPRSEKCIGGTSDNILIDEWTINCITYDLLDPDVINSDETAEIITKLMHPIFANGMVEISISTNHGNPTEKTITLP